MLLEQYPRPTWREHRSPGARFWLSIHDGFRREAAQLRAIADEYRTQKISPPELAVRASPRLQGMIAHLHGHHEIEDFHYFPSFRESERRLAEGFDALGRDHERLLADIGTATAAADALMMAAHSAGEAAAAQRAAAQRYIDASERLFARLLRHLIDEEDLIIPLLIDRQSVY